MFKTILLALGLVLSINVQANTGTATINDIASNLNKTILNDVEMQGPFNWAVGDTATYNLKSGFISGTMTMIIKAVSASELVIGQELDMGFVGKQSCEMTINPQTGKLLKMVCNGQDQTPSDEGTLEVIESKEDTITVPAGTFVCLYIKAKQTAQEKETIIQQWANPKLVPVMGLIKAISPSPLGEVNIELVSFKKM